MNDQKTPQVKEKPEFGEQFGFLYPLAWVILDVMSKISLYSLLPIQTLIGSDIYVISWFIIGIVALALSATSSVFLLWCIIIVCGYRYIEIMGVLLSILVRRFIKTNPQGQARASANRTLLLILINGLELFIIFAALVQALSVVYPEQSCFNVGFEGRLDALYYSVVTATTLGYGDISPTGSISKSLAIIEVLSMFLVFVVVVANVASQRSNIPDLE